MFKMAPRTCANLEMSFEKINLTTLCLGWVMALFH